MLANVCQPCFRASLQTRSISCSNMRSRSHPRRVGRVGTLDLEDKIDMAVAAHARHKCTNYDLLLTNQGVKKSLARRIVLSDVQAVLTTWRGEKWQPRHVAECAVLRSHVRRDKSAAMKHETVLRCSAARRAVPDKGPIQRKAKKVRRRTQEIQAARRRLVTPGKEPNVIEQDDSDVEVPNLTKNRVELENDFLDEPNLAPKLGSDEEFVPSDDDLGSVSSSPPTRRRSLRLSIASSSALITKKTASNTTRGLLKRNEMVKGRVTETVRPGSQMLSASTSFGSGNSNDVFIFISDDDENTLDKSKQASTINLATVSNAHLPPPKTRLVGGEEKRSSSVKRPPKSERKKLKKKRRAERKLLRRVQKAEIELKNELANPKREARRQRQGQPS